MENLLGNPPARNEGIRPRVKKSLQEEYVAVNSYTLNQQKILGLTIDDVETDIDLATYDRMENDSTIFKSKRILLTSVLSDELQLAPGATEEQVGQEEYQTYVAVMEFCQRVVAGLDKPIRDFYEQILGNATKYGHGIAEIEWAYRMDGESTKPKALPERTGIGAFFSKWNFFSAAEPVPVDPSIKRPALKSNQLRLMPKSIKVKPRGAARFVVDDFMNVIGLVANQNGYGTNGIGFNKIIDRRKFAVLTLNKQNEDPRGRSTYRPAWNWFNLKSQLPAEMLRFILEESVPKAVGTLPENAPAFEFERDENGNQVYEDPDTMQIPKMKTAAESMGDQIRGFRSGSGAVLPYGATLKPFKTSGSSDADFFGKIMKVINPQMEEAILLQTLAQSEGEHQARSASQQVAEVLHSLVFFVRWCMSTMTVMDILETAVSINLGPWAVRYMPQASLGDSVRRDWSQYLHELADAYFKGFIDDSQRPELMSWMSLPKPGPSRAQVQAELDPTTGGARMPNANRPDKQAGQKDRNKEK